MNNVVRLDRRTGDEPERDVAADRAKGSFKLDLIETANADPLLNGSDVKLLIAFCSVMSWPKREAWLSNTLARAKTGLAASQVINSRWRLRGIDKAKVGEQPQPFRTYLHHLRTDGGRDFYRIENPWLEGSRDHVREATDFHRQKQAERKAERRRVKRVTPKNGGTEEALSLQNSGGTSLQKMVAITPHQTPQYLALKKETPSQGYAVLRDDDPDCPFPVPANPSEAEHMLAEIIGGRTVSEIGRATLKARLSKGDLSPADVERWRALHDGVPV